MNFQKILVVCAGNICRSPMAEAVLKQQFPHLTISSAGIVAMIDHPADDKAQHCMQILGLDISAHRAKKITVQDIKDADIVLTMSLQQQYHIEKLFPFSKGKVFRLGHWQNQDISDPYQKEQQAFDEACKRIYTFTQDWNTYFKAGDPQ